MTKVTRPPTGINRAGASFPFPSNSFLRFTLIAGWIAFMMAVTSAWGKTTPGTQDQGKPTEFFETFDGNPGEIPKGWKPIKFQKIDHTTRYELAQDQGRTVLLAQADQSASGLVWDQDFEPAKTPWVSWDWKISAVLPNGDVTTKKGDDFSARVLVLFPYDPEAASPWDALKFEVAKALYGEYPPAAAITYIWANRLPQNTWVTSTYTDRVRLLAVDSGNDRAGQWQSVRRNIARDFQAAFPGQTLPPRFRVALMTDTDNTKDSTKSWFDSIRVAGK